MNSFTHHKEAGSRRKQKAWPEQESEISLSLEFFTKIWEFFQKKKKLRIIIIIIIIFIISHVSQPSFVIIPRKEQICMVRIIIV